MQTLEFFHVDAFASELFHGNPAGVCILAEWLPDTLMQAIAFENNLAETAFAVARGERFELRWFTPVVEVPLCGHATLATAHVLFNELGLESQQVEFDTKSGALQVRRGEPAWLELPAFHAEPAACPEGLARALGAEPRSVHRARYWICEFADDAALLALAPDFRALARMDRSIAVTAASRTPGVDFVSRFFAGPVGIDEDPVTGSAHADLAPFWGRRLGKIEMHARQLSRRGGELECRVVGERVQLGGRCVTYSRGQLRLPVP